MKRPYREEEWGGESRRAPKNSQKIKAQMGESNPQKLRNQNQAGEYNSMRKSPGSQGEGNRDVEKSWRASIRTRGSLSLSLFRFLSFHSKERK